MRDKGGKMKSRRGYMPPKRTRPECRRWKGKNITSVIVRASEKKDNTNIAKSTRGEWHRLEFRFRSDQNSRPISPASPIHG
jgi:hypothetical protein